MLRKQKSDASRSCSCVRRIMSRVDSWSYIRGMKEIIKNIERYFAETIENVQGLDNRQNREYNSAN